MDSTERPVFELIPEEVPKRQNVKRGIAVDDHERDRDYLTAAEMDALLASAKKGRFGNRDYPFDEGLARSSRHPTHRLVQPDQCQALR